MPHYRGAGILFIAATAPRGHQLLLARRKSGIWSIPGGGSTRHDADADATAWRETREEFGHPPQPGQVLFTQRYPFSLFGFDWTTLVVELPAIPDPSLFPSPHAHDLHREFTEARWFPITRPPKRTHLLLYPILLRLRTRRPPPDKNGTSLTPELLSHEPTTFSISQRLQLA
jgi:8-oxo-dGTP pyrophosphatase MutT (NUDIX family)